MTNERSVEDIRIAHAEAVEFWKDQPEIAHCAHYDRGALLKAYDDLRFQCGGMDMEITELRARLAARREECAKVADAKAQECERMAQKHPEHVLKFVRDCAVAQTIAHDIRAMPGDELDAMEAAE